MSFVLGITGGISSGKSTVVSIFRQWGFPIIDADIIARAVVEPETPGLAKLVAEFGKEILLSDGSLDRKKLGAKIFGDEKKRQKVNALLAGFLQAEISREIEEAKEESDLVIADIPLLYEAGYAPLMDEVAVVYVPAAIQLERLMKRDQISQETAQQKIDSQWPIEEKKQKADIVFDNQGTIEETQEQVVSWLKQNHF